MGFVITADQDEGRTYIRLALRPCWPWTAQRHADKFRACGWQHVRVGWRWK